MQAATEANMKYAGLPHGTLRGTIVDVEDPEERGRVRVIFDDVNPDIPQVSGAGDWSNERLGEKPDKSHWIDMSPAFKGKQPEGMLNKRITISASNGQFQYAVGQDQVFDQYMLAENKKDELEMPNNSSMTRLPCYESGSLPPASKENIGCMVVECGGPMESDWLCVCLQRQGSFYWVRHIDLAHGHAGENDGKQGNDTDGEGEAPVEEQSVWDFVFPTTGGEMEKKTKFSKDPRPNPFGSDAKWYEPPK
jgi:hypothetical protein